MSNNSTIIIEPECLFNEFLFSSIQLMHTSNELAISLKMDNSTNKLFFSSTELQLPCIISIEKKAQILFVVCINLQKDTNNWINDQYYLRINKDWYACIS